MSGGVVSRTVTVNCAVVVFGGVAASDAVKVTVVAVGPVPLNGNVAPDACDAATGRLPLTASVAVGIA